MKAARLPSLTELLSDSMTFIIAMRTPFRGIAFREGMVLRGPQGWAEFAPFTEYGPAEAARWLSAAIEVGWQQWPPQLRQQVPVNAIVPAVPPRLAKELVIASGCSTVKVKVAQQGETIDDDIARVAAVREVVGAGGQLRVDANGAWSLPQAVTSLTHLAQFGLQYAEQPCSSLTDLAQLRRKVDVPLAVDESLRKSADPMHVEGVREAADIIVIKVPPLGGISAALSVAERYGLPAVVSSALDTSIGLSAALACAAALPDLPYACGLDSGRLLTADVVADPLASHDGLMDVRRPVVDREKAAAVTADGDTTSRWRQRIADAYDYLSHEWSSTPAHGSGGDE